MIKKTITYPDLDGNNVTEDFYFHLNKAEVIRMELLVDGGLSAKLQRLIDSKKGADIIRNFEDIILAAYGQRSEDNRRFIKSQELRDAFSQSEAYSVLFMELIGDDKASSEFVLGMMPADLAQGVEDKLGVQSNVFQDALAQAPSAPTQAVNFSAADIMSMSEEQFRAMRDQLKN